LEYHRLVTNSSAKLCGHLAAVLENPQETDSGPLWRIGNALASLANKMDSQAALEIANCLAAALENPQEANSVRRSSLGHAVAALANKLEPQAAAKIARQVHRSSPQR
jgi:hypothetical protein